MLPDLVSNPGPLTYESGALPIALRGPAIRQQISIKNVMSDSVQELLMLYKNRIIDVEVLKNALKAFNYAPRGPQPQGRNLTDKVREK